MLSNRLVSLKKTLSVYKIYSNLKQNRENGLNLILNQLKRCVHSSNIQEMDFLFSKYKLTKISNEQQSYGQKSSLHHFNTIDDFDFKSEKELTSETLKRLLNIRKSDANNLVKNYPNLLEMSAEKKLEKQILFLAETFSLTTDDFLSCPWILYLPSNFIVERMNPLNNKLIDKNYLVLLLLPLKTFKFVLSKIKNKKFRKNIYQDFNEKLDLFTTKLHLFDQEFCDLIHENVFLFYYDYSRLKTVMDLVVSAGIEPDTILSDIRIFTHNIELMEKRINLCVENKMPIKTWMLRSPEETFQVSLRRHLENKRILRDYDNNIEFMANQLNCRKAVIYSMMSRYPGIVRISAKKVRQMLSFLFGKGFKSYHIVNTPKILFHSVHKITERVNDLEEIQIKPNSLQILTLSQKEYNKLLDQIKDFNDINGNNSDIKS